MIGDIGPEEREVFEYAVKTIWPGGVKKYTDQEHEIQNNAKGKEVLGNDFLTPTLRLNCSIRRHARLPLAFMVCKRSSSWSPPDDVHSNQAQAAWLDFTLFRRCFRKVPSR